MVPRSRASVGLLLFLAYMGLRRSPITFAMLVLAVAAGESFQIPNTANLAGYEAELISQAVEKGAGEVRVRPRSSQRFAEADALAARVAQIDGVRAVEPLWMLPGALGASDRWLSAPVLGIDAGASRKPYRIAEGGPLAAGERDGVLVGATLASRLKLSVGGRVELRILLDMAAAPPAAPPIDPARGPRSVGAYPMTVRGLLRGAFTADEVVVVDRRFLIEETGASGAASILFVYSDAPAAAEALARRIERDLPDVEARTWLEDSAFLGSAIQGNRAINGISSAMSMIGVAIPVWALLFVSVAQRRREIGLYGALGFGPRRVFAVFLFQALVVGLIGVSLGVLGGYGLVRWFVAHPLFDNGSFVIRPVLSAAAIAQSVLTILGTTLVASVYPAIRAARTDPAAALRGLS